MYEIYVFINAELMPKLWSSLCGLEDYELVVSKSKVALIKVFLSKESEKVKSDWIDDMLSFLEGVDLIKWWSCNNGFVR